MKLSIETYSLTKRFDEKHMLLLLRDCGFDSIDYSFYWMDQKYQETVLGEGYIEHAKELRATLDSIGITCNQAHAPFNLNADRDSFTLDCAPYLEIVRSIEAAAILGASQIVVHSLTPKSGETLLETNVRYFKSLAPYAEKAGIKIALENLFGGRYDDERKVYTQNRFDRPESMKELVAALDNDVFVCLIDIGHTIVTGIKPEDYIRGLGGELLAGLHVQDNRLERDDHMLPYTGKLNWNAITESLAEIGYNGDVTFEIFGYLESFPTSVYPEVLMLAAGVGRELIEKIQK